MVTMGHGDRTKVQAVVTDVFCRFLLCRDVRNSYKHHVELLTYFIVWWTGPNSSLRRESATSHQGGAAPQQPALEICRIERYQLCGVENLS